MHLYRLDPIESAMSDKESNTNSKTVEEKARDVALKCSKSPVMVSKRLDNLKSKLNDEKARSGVVAKRKITEHKEPLYFLVVKETIKEYEQKMNLEDDDDGSEYGTEEQKAEFLQILQEKLNDKIPQEVSREEEQGYDDLTLSNQRRKSLAEPAYAEVIRKTLEQFGKRKVERRRSLAAGEDIKASPSPNLFNMFEENLMKNHMIEEESESESESDDEEDRVKKKDSMVKSEDPVYMIVLKQALKQRRKSLHHKLPGTRKQYGEIIEEEDGISNKTTTTMLEKKVRKILLITLIDSFYPADT